MGVTLKELRLIVLRILMANSPLSPWKKSDGYGLG